MPGRWIAILVALVVASMVTAVTGRAANEAAYSISFPDDWVVDDLGSGEPLGSEAASAGPPIMLRLRAYPPDRSEGCMIVDFQAVGAAIFPLGVDDPMTLGRIAADILDHSMDGATSSSLGYGDPWSSWFKGEPVDGESYVLYTYLGPDARPGLDGEWLVLDCHSDSDFHMDWSLIARTFEFLPDEEE